MSKYVIQHILCKLLVYLNSYCFYSQVVVLDGFNFWELNGVLALNSAVRFHLTSLQCPKVDAQTFHSDVQHPSAGSFQEMGLEKR